MQSASALLWLGMNGLTRSNMCHTAMDIQKINLYIKSIMAHIPITPTGETETLSFLIGTGEDRVCHQDTWLLIFCMYLLNSRGRVSQKH